ncbi:MAG TPA: hypothetical protein DCY25_00240, partial [Bacteroidales bacterium]|nr:hypothetical protein [Bacteroidales bacterium]
CGLNAYTYFPIIRKVQWNTFFCYRQLQLTGWRPPNPFFRDFSPGEGKGAKAPRPTGCSKKKETRGSLFPYLNACF